MFSLSKLLFLLTPRLCIFTQDVFCAKVVSRTTTTSAKEGLSEAEVLEQAQRSTVSLKQYSFYEDDYSDFCTGSIISKYWILTAAHCLTDKVGIPDYIAVDAGSVYLNNVNGSRYKISDYYVHPNESESVRLYKDDLCLIKLENPIEFTKNIQPVHFGTIKDQEEVSILGGGWGRVSQNGPSHKKLRFHNLKTMKYDECQRLHDTRDNIVDRVYHICGFGSGGKTLCFGDSGGPLYDPSTGYQVGVFSALEDCSGRFPVLFMRVSTYIDWINDVTELELTLN